MPDMTPGERIGVRAVSQALAQRHVLGIADMIEHSLGLKSAAGLSHAGTPPGSHPRKINEVYFR